MVTLITYFTNSTEEFELSNKKLEGFSVVFGTLLQRINMNGDIVWVNGHIIWVNKCIVWVN